MVEINRIVEVIENGLFETVSLPEFGRQDVGVSPGGVMDRFSFETGNVLLGNSPDAPALEIIIAPVIKFCKPCWFILTGAGYDDVVLKGENSKSVEHGVVSYAPAGSQISFGRKVYGFRSYLCFRPADTTDKDIGGRKRGNFNDIASWVDYNGRIRVVKGPEFNLLNKPEQFLNSPWRISLDTNRMGMRLESCTGESLSVVSERNMISGPVSDGTVQLTPEGPIVLLKHRQTIGGYPRIFNVISVDVDLLAQYYPGQILRFRAVSHEEAIQSLKNRQADLEIIRQQNS